MTVDELVDYYASLLILQYLAKPNAVASIKALVRPAIVDKIFLDIENAFDLSTSIGVQLDTLGKYAGVTRNGYALNGDPISLVDDDFRILIQLAIIQYNAGSSLATIEDLLNTYFPGTILVFDYLDMRMSYYLDPAVGSQDLAELFITEHLLPKPMGVQLGATIFSPDILIFFGFRTYDIVAHNVSPLNTYSVYNMSYPMLTYDDALGV